MNNSVDKNSAKSSKDTKTYNNESVNDSKNNEVPEKLFIGGFPPRCKEGKY